MEYRSERHSALLRALLQTDKVVVTLLLYLDVYKIVHSTRNNQKIIARPFPMRQGAGQDWRKELIPGLSRQNSPLAPDLVSNLCAV